VTLVVAFLYFSICLRLLWACASRKACEYASFLDSDEGGSVGFEMTTNRNWRAILEA
jgi:hypothetical protein